MVDIEVDIAPGLPQFTIVGLADTALDQSRHRVRSALKNSGLGFPDSRVIVNLSPASVPKHGSAFDLPIAIALLAAQGIVDPARAREPVLFGELSLDGRLRPVRGSLAAMLAATRQGVREAYLPEGNVVEAQMLQGLEAHGVTDLTACAVSLGADLALRDAVPIAASRTVQTGVPHPGDLCDVLGQPDAVRALVAAAAGGHHCLLVGEPGAGKTMLAERLPGLLPDLTPEASMSVTALHSLVHGIDELITRPPWQAPHQTATAPALVGGGSGHIQPGAMSLASEGVLFLDEAPEFSPRVLDSLRQSLESGRVEIHRARTVCAFPARFQLILAANPCPCGKAFDPAGTCTCAPAARRRYLRRLSGPLLDRMDLRVLVPRASLAAVRTGQPTLSTEAARVRVQEARDRMSHRLEGTPWTLNSQVPGGELRGRFRLPPSATTVLDSALERGILSLRGYDRTLRLSWTVADLEGLSSPGREQVAQALSWREVL